MTRPPDDAGNVARTAIGGADYAVVVADALPELDQRLSDELDRVNADATPDVAPAAS